MNITAPSLRFFPFLRRGFALPAALPLLFAMLLPGSAAQAQRSAGTLDAGFSVGLTNDANLVVVTEQSDGKVLFGGINPRTINGVPIFGFTRVNADGSQDTSFQQPKIESYNTLTDNIFKTTQRDYIVEVYAIVPQADGKILVGGNFYFVDGVSGYGGLVRFNADGTVDSSFKAPRFNGTVYTIVPVADGNFLVGGDFTLVDSKQKSVLARIGSDGKYDGSFNPDTFSGVLNLALGSRPSIRSIAVQSDGKILVGGTFSGVGKSSLPGLARLNKDGSVDSGYKVDPALNPISTFGNTVYAIYSLAVLPGDKLLVGGERHDPNRKDVATPTEINGLFRLNTDGSIDNTFNAGAPEQTSG